VCLLAVAALAGCKSSPPKDRPAPPANVQAGNSSSPFWADANASRNPAPASIGPGPTARADPVSQPGNDPEIAGILAGRIVDGYGRSPSAAYVQVSLVRDGRAEPIADVETVNQGHFYIRGLQPGRTYKLVARTRQDGHVLVGEVQARPPETRLMIPLGEELAGSTTPAIPAAPLPPTGRLSSGDVRPVPPSDSPVAPAAGLGPPAATGIGGPEFGGSDQTASAPAPPMPRMNLPAPVAVPPIQPQSFNTSPSGPPMPPVSAGPACLVNGNRVVSLRLPDVDGHEWDFATRRGRLVLLDFWGTWCGPCLRAVPEVSRLNSTYGGSGLEVVGVACERGTPAENANRVRATRQRLGISYRLVLADSSNQCQDQFHITGYPTLILIAGDGTILWRGTPDQDRELEGIVRRRLGY
jgi:thiol-disulfide isomerase/thioredoxin